MLTNNYLLYFLVLVSFFSLTHVCVGVFDDSGSLKKKAEEDEEKREQTERNKKKKRT